MKNWLFRFLATRGFTSETVSRYRLTKYADSSIGIERYYRFRWQRMNMKRGPFSLQVWWGRQRGARGVPARAKDAGQARDAIEHANRGAENRKLARRKVKDYILDLDAVGKTPAPPPAEPTEERIVKP